MSFKLKFEHTYQYEKLTSFEKTRHLYILNELDKPIPKVFGVFESKPFLDDIVQGTKKKLLKRFVV